MGGWPSVPDDLPTSAFDYQLPPELIAQYPAEKRDESRLLVLDRASGAIAHRRFRDIVAYIPAGDALVVNETRVFPARLLGRRVGGGEAEILLLRPLAEAPWQGDADIAADASIPAHLRHLGGEWACVPFGRSGRRFARNAALVRTVVCSAVSG